MKHLVIYVHGKGGNANEAEHYKPFFAESDVIGFDYQAQNPWEAQKEFSSFFELHSQRYDSVTLIANSIGAFFSMSALTKKQVAQAILISPVVNMEKLIVDMMMWANVTEEELCIKRKFLRNLEKHFPGNTYVMYGNIPLSGMCQPVFYMEKKII